MKQMLCFAVWMCILSADVANGLVYFSYWISIWALNSLGSPYIVEAINPSFH